MQELTCKPCQTFSDLEHIRNKYRFHMEQGFHNGNHYKLYCLLGLVHLHWKKEQNCTAVFVL